MKYGLKIMGSDMLLMRLLQAPVLELLMLRKMLCCHGVFTLKEIHM